MIGTQLPPGIPVIPIPRIQTAIGVRDLRYPTVISGETGRSRGMLFQSVFQNNGAYLTTTAAVDLWVPNPNARIRLKKIFVIPGGAFMGAATLINVDILENDSPINIRLPIPLAAALNVTLPHFELDLGEGYVTREPGAKLRCKVDVTIVNNGMQVIAGGNEEIDVAPNV